MPRQAIAPAACSTSTAPSSAAATPAAKDGDAVAEGTHDREHDGRVAAEKARLVRSLLAEANALRRVATTDEARRLQLAAFAEDRRRLLREAAQARAETARYRELVIDLENNAPPPLLDGPHAPDDLKLIVGIGPVLERMLHRLGVATYRQIARWSERDIDEFDAQAAGVPGPHPPRRLGHAGARAAPVASTARRCRCASEAPVAMGKPISAGRPASWRTRCVPILRPDALSGAATGRC